MTRKEIIKILTLLSQTYDKFEKRVDTDEKVENMIMLWTECLGDLDYNLVLQAVKKTIIESPYMPTIHEIRKNAIEMVKPNISKTAIEAWNEAYSMICNGLYMTEEQFEMASPEVKKFFGNVRQVKELSQTDSDTVNTVTKGQFLKQYEIIIEREKQDKLLPEKMQNLIKGLTSKIEIKQIGE